MVRLAQSDEHAWEIHTSYETHPIRLMVSEEDTIQDIKHFLADWKPEWELYPDEMRFLCREALLGERELMKDITLHSMVPSPLVLEEDEAGDDIWWAQDVPMRHLCILGGAGRAGRAGGEAGEEEEKRQETRVLDLRFLSSDPRRIRSWLYGARDITEIWILATHPKCDEILYAVAEDVRCLPCLSRIHIQHPSDAGFLLPPRSGRRFASYGRESQMSRDALSYLTQHLQIDAYREDEVEIWVDGDGTKDRHRLLVYP